MSTIHPFFLESRQDCTLCPRQCHADRAGGSPGYCATGTGFEIASICLHRGEEPVLGGEQGVCNIFFTHCNLQCRFCQNDQISRNHLNTAGRSLTLDQVVQRLEVLLNAGARAVGFVSPSHVLPQVAAILQALRDRGRRPVFIYNSNGYDRVESLAALSGRIGVYLPDFKYGDARLAAEYSDAPDYPEAAAAALREMFRQKGVRLEFDGSGLVTSGLIVRHLVLPGQVENSRRVLRFLARELSPEIHVSLMSQYTPTQAVAADPALGRCLTAGEYGEVLREMERLGMENGWMQGLDSQNHYQPDFRRRHPFGDES